MRLSDKYYALKSEKDALLAEARGLLFKAEEGHRDLTPDEKKRFDVIDENLKRVNRGIETELAALDLPAARLYADGSSFGAHAGTPPSRGGRKYADLFGAPAGNDGFKTFNEYLGVVHSGVHHPNIRMAMREGVGSEGGFLVPEEFAAGMLDAALESEIVRPRAQVVPMISATKKVGGFDMSDNSGSAPGGFSGQWLAEEGSATDVTGKTRLITLATKKLACFTKSSNELVADGMDFERLLGEVMIGAVSWNLDVAFLTGSGAGQPLGVVNNNSIVTVDKEVGQLGSTITYGNLAAMYARLHPACVKNSVWVCNNSAIPQLLQLTLGVGTGGTHFPVLRESDGRFYIFGREVLFTEKLPILGAKGDILLVDFSQYVVGLRKEVSLERSIHVGWQTDQTGYRAIVRADGQGKWESAFTPKAGPTLSWAVALAARA